LALLIAGCSSGGGKQSAATTLRASTTTSAPSSCLPQGAVVVNLGGSGRVGNTSQPERTITVGQSLWVTDRPAAPSLSAPASDYLTYPHSPSKSLRVVCHAGTNGFVGTLFQATASGTASVSSEARCAYGCNALGFGAKITVESQSRAAAINLGPCPKTYPNTPFAKLNAGVNGLDKKLVPIIASRVRVCSYQTVPNGKAAVGSPPPSTAVAQLENETNRLQKRPIYYWRDGCVKHPGTLFVTFASDSQRVDLLAIVGCDSPATNGVLHVDPTAKWLNELQRYASPHTSTVPTRPLPPCLPGPTGPGASPGPTGPACQGATKG